MKMLIFNLHDKQKTNCEKKRKKKTWNLNYFTPIHSPNKSLHKQRNCEKQGTETKNVNQKRFFQHLLYVFHINKKTNKY